MNDHLNPPHGGHLVDLVVEDDRAGELKKQSPDWPSWDLTPRQLCDLEMLCNGSFSPLTGFMGKADYESVCDKMRLADGTLWTMPITLDVSKEFAEKLKPGATVALRDAEGVMLAVINVEDIWEPDRESEAEQVFGTTDTEPPGRQLPDEPEQAGLHRRHVECLQLPLHYDYKSLRNTPAELREEFAKRGWSRDRRLPNPQPDAPRAPRAHAPRREGRRAPTCSSTRSSA